MPAAEAHSPLPTAEAPLPRLLFLVPMRNNPPTLPVCVIRPTCPTPLNLDCSPPLFWQLDSARGILEHARLEYPEQFKDEFNGWYELLQDWTQALQAYEKIEEKRELYEHESLRVMRCHNALSDWEPLSQLARRLWQPVLPSDVRTEVAILGAHAEFNLAVGAGTEGGLVHWEAMEGYVREVNTRMVRARLPLHFHSPQFRFFRARCGPLGKKGAVLPSDIF